MDEGHNDTNIICRGYTQLCILQDLDVSVVTLNAASVRRIDTDAGVFFQWLTSSSTTHVSQRWWHLYKFI
jgi:hypothetical protein